MRRQRRREGASGRAASWDEDPSLGQALGEKGATRRGWRSRATTSQVTQLGGRVSSRAASSRVGVQRRKASFWSGTHQDRSCEGGATSFVRAGAWSGASEIQTGLNEGPSSAWERWLASVGTWEGGKLGTVSLEVQGREAQAACFSRCPGGDSQPGYGGARFPPLGAAFRIAGSQGPFRSTSGGCYEECPPSQLPRLWPQDRVYLKVGLDIGQSGENLLFQEMLQSESGLTLPS